MTFTPPRTSSAPNVLPDTTGLARRLFRHYTLTPQAVNVYLLTDDTVVEDYPPTLYNSDGSVATSGQDRIRRAFTGSGAHPVTAAEAALLTDAGYTVD